MTCLSPVVIYQKNSLQRFRIVPCGRCMPCRINKTQAWVVRLELEKMVQEKTCFVTLTYDDSHLPKDKGLHKKDLQLFFKRLRKYGLKFRYYAVGEYGEQEQKYYSDDEKILVELGKINPHGRPHYHILFFGIDFNEPDNFRLLQKAWLNCSSDYFSIHQKKLIGSVQSSSIRYVCDYMQKKQYGLNSTKEYFNIQAPFSLCSQKLGLAGFEKDLDIYKEHGFILYNGHKVPIPRYFRDKFEIDVCFNISDDNIYLQRCIEKGYIKQSDISFYKALSRVNHTNEFFHIVWRHENNHFSEMNELIKKRNFLYNRSKI